METTLQFVFGLGLALFALFAPYKWHNMPPLVVDVALVLGAALMMWSGFHLVRPFLRKSVGAPKWSSPNITIEKTHAHLVAASATAETKRPAPVAPPQVGPETTVIPEPQSAASYPSLAGLDLSVLYARDSEHGTVLLKFLPDGDNRPQKVIELVLFGNILLLGMERTPLAAADYAVEKSKVLVGFLRDGRIDAFVSGRTLAEFAAGNGMGSRIIIEGLATSRMLRLNHALYGETAYLAADLIRRAH
jgi:hypothetical protein